MRSCKKLCFPTVPVNLVAREFSTQPTRGVLCAVLGVDFETYSHGRAIRNFEGM